jgi:hypothetical protein
MEVVSCENDAMQEAIAPVVAEEFGLNVYASKGWSSASYAFEAAEEMPADGWPTTVYVLSDFDPAGFRIAEGIGAGLREHLRSALHLAACRIAVTHEQVSGLKSPTRQVKRSDARAPTPWPATAT